MALSTTSYNVLLHPGYIDLQENVNQNTGQEGYGSLPSRDREVLKGQVIGSRRCRPATSNEMEDEDVTMVTPSKCKRTIKETVHYVRASDLSVWEPPSTESTNVTLKDIGIFY